jgi:hypothetical protein
LVSTEKGRIQKEKASVTIIVHDSGSPVSGLRQLSHKSAAVKAAPSRAA